MHIFAYYFAHFYYLLDKSIFNQKWEISSRYKWIALTHNTKHTSIVVLFVNFLNIQIFLFSLKNLFTVAIHCQALFYPLLVQTIDSWTIWHNREDWWLIMGDNIHHK